MESHAILPKYYSSFENPTSQNSGRQTFDPPSAKTVTLWTMPSGAF